MAYDDDDLEQRVRRILAARDRERRGDAPNHQKDWPFIDWHQLWASDTPDQDWLLEPLFPRGRGIAVVAGAKTGKSYLLLYCAAALATGRPVLYRNGNSPALRVLYLDLEMTEADLLERLEIFGYTEDDAAALEGHLCYILNPDLPYLDTKQGGEALCELADDHDIDLVVIDTLGKAIEGDENDADSLRAFYRHTGQALKRQGVTWVRADHLGKDPTRGARGTSAKNDDVDLVWQLRRTDAGVEFHATHRRLGWVPERVPLNSMEDEEPAWFKPVPKAWPAGTQETADRLDDLQIPLDATARHALKALRDAGQGVRTGVVCAAQNWRRDPNRPRETRSEPLEF